MEIEQTNNHDAKKLCGITIFLPNKQHCINNARAGIQYIIFVIFQGIIIKDTGKKHSQIKLKRLLKV